jgi:hypothetical protein
MKQLLWIIGVIALLVGVMSPEIHAQTRQVTFIVNTATVPDTLLPASDVRITGSGAALTNWGSGVACTNIGGDYWSATVGLNDDDTVRYKIRIGGNGWEENVDEPYGLGGNDRAFIVDNHADTTLPVQFWNNGPRRPQYFRPWTDQPDTFINVYFRVDMQGIIQSGAFNWNDLADGDSVGVRGDGKGGDMNWAPTFYLTRESPPTNSASAFTVPANSFFSGRVRFRKSQVNAGDVIQYKFLIGADWGRDEYQGHPNRTFPIPQGLKDTTLQYVYFNDQRPNQRANGDTCIVTFRANMQAAIQKGGFSIGDTVVARSGFFGTAMQSGREIRLLRQGLSTTYAATDTVISSVGQPLDYQYYVIKYGTDTRENYYNFNYNGGTPSEAERRMVTVPSKTFSIYDTATSITSARRQPVFPNSRVLARNVNVRWEVDVRPAIYQVLGGDTLTDIQGTFHVQNADSVLVWGVWMNGPAVGGWSNIGSTDWDFGLMNNLDKKLYDDGSNGDLVAGDSIYTRMVLASPDSLGLGSKGVVGQVFKFGIRGGDNEGGTGGFGNNHLENIDDADTAFTIHSQFGSINPAFYDKWDYDCGCPATSVGVNDPDGLPKEFSLKQNYPNPFNPTTRIEYTIPNVEFVTLKVYNLLGQEVSTLVNTRQGAGKYSVNFNSSSLPSGVYFYKITAGTFVSSKKMLIMK